MAKSQETFGKKEKEKKRKKLQLEKKEKMEERKANFKKGKTLDEMMAYIDENGNISSTPPDPRKRKIYNLEDMQTGVPKQRAVDPAELIRSGVVTFFNDAKGFGFIKDLQTQESVFIHVNQLSERIAENDKVSFEVEMGHKGPSAINVKKI
ncbi:MAG TPA: cold shock domain-containing protein [Puia sp.]|jgi:cold shock CspA family protein|nr:cold shock domain-containing protein [Puia sp.]